ncbi:MAG: integrase domain-containing protein [Aeromonas sp.]
MSKDHLSDARVRSEKPREKEFNLSDGDGLYLRVMPKGSKLWVFNYRRPIDKRRSNLSFGTYPDVSVATARDRRQEARSLVARGIDPKAHKAEMVLIAKAKREADINTFERVANKWIELKRHETSDKHANEVWRSIELHIMPKLGAVAVELIRAPVVIEIIRPLERAGKLDTVRRLCQRLNEILDYAVNYGLLTANPCTAIHKVFKTPTKKNMPTLKPDELPRLMADLANGRIEDVTRLQIEWSLHTLVRPAESAGTRWDEIDLEAKVWNIPAERMKMDRPHRVPLTPQSIAILERMKPISGHRPFVFTGHCNPMTHVNEQTANAALKRIGYGGRLVAHGLRSLGSTTLNEQGFNPDAIEAVLSHADDNAIRRAYNRTDYFKQRVIIMDWWSEHIEQASQGNFLLAGRFKALKLVNE